MVTTSCVIYTRQSSDPAGEAAAVTRQEDACRELAARNGWDVVRVFSDNDRSAVRGVRPAWREMLAEVRRGRVTVVVAWHTDRLYRRVRDTLDLMEAGLAHGLKIETVMAGSLDLATPAGRMIATQLAAVGGYEGEQKSARQKAANLQRARRGVVSWTRRPYGFAVEDGKVAIVGPEAKEIRAAAKRVLSGTSVAKVVADMNARGLRTSAGSEWTPTALRRILINPRHAGRAVSLGEDFGRGTWPAILDGDTADRLVALFTDPRRRNSPPSSSVKYLLSGIALCGKCGEEVRSRMFAQPTTTRSGGRRMTYRCRRVVHLVRGVEEVDLVVTEAVIARLSRPDAVDLLQADVDLDALRAQITELRDRRDGLAGLLADGLLSGPAVRDQATKLTVRISELEQQITAATGDGPLAQMVGVDDVRAVWRKLDLRSRRAIIQTLLDVTVLPVGSGTRFTDRHVSVEWKQ